MTFRYLAGGVMRSTVIDVTSLAGIESISRGSSIDPWATRIGGNLVDLFVFSDTVAYPLPTSSRSELQASTLWIIDRINSRDSDALVPLPYSTDTIAPVSEQFLEDCIAQFMGWCGANPRKAAQWMKLHQESWVNDWHNERFPHLYSFDVQRLAGRPDIRTAARRLSVPVATLLYTLDVVLRYPILGRLAGEGRPYLNHPVRASIAHPTLAADAGQAPVSLGPISFSSTVASMMRSMTLDEYCVLLHELRGAVRDSGIHRVAPGQVEPEVVRELAARVALPAKLGAFERRLALAAGMLGGAASTPVVGPAGPILGVGLSIAQYYWSGDLPRAASRVRWLRWALSWEIESQARG
ncbi:hypothetical protein ABZS44_23785 [Micromonospora sediminicola]|uniref:hypothetical protein n=1 Tax=Micromonospora sediminicola TaxID=946078 RepID=UPI0033B53378